MKPNVFVIEPVEWYVPPDPAIPWDQPSYRHCDMCEYTATDGIGIDPKWLVNSRQFWFDHESGLSVCEKCIDAYLEEPNEVHE